MESDPPEPSVEKGRGPAREVLEVEPGKGGICKKAPEPKAGVTELSMGLEIKIRLKV